MKERGRGWRRREGRRRSGSRKRIKGGVIESERESENRVREESKEREDNKGTERKEMCV